MLVSFSRLGANFVISDSVKGILYSGVSPFIFTKDETRVIIFVKDFFTLNLLPAEIQYISGVAPDPTLDGIINQLTQMLGGSYSSSSDTLSIAAGDTPGQSFALVSGKIASLSTAGAPADIWSGGSSYPGFPSVATPLLFQAVSTNAGDTGILEITYLASNISTDYQMATVAMNGTTAVDFAVSGIRVIKAVYNGADKNAFNLGAITIRHKVTPTNVFGIIEIGKSKMLSAVYTVPYGCKSFLYDVNFVVGGDAATIAEVSLVARENTKSPIVTRPTIVTFNSPSNTRIDGKVMFTALTDIVLRVISCVATSVPVYGSMTLLTVKDVTIAIICVFLGGSAIQLS